LNPLELRKIIGVGYALDAPEGAPMLYPNGMPMRLDEAPVRMRFVFWVPQPPPYRRRPVGTFEELLRSVVRVLAASRGLALDEEQTTLVEYMHRHNLERYALDLRDPPQGYTLVADALPFELEALRAGVIAEQVQDVTFPRMPELHELRTHLMPHWEQRTLASLGYLPNKPPQADDPAPGVRFQVVTEPAPDARIELV
jgi:hypothetical protein